VHPRVLGAVCQLLCPDLAGATVLLALHSSARSCMMSEHALRCGFSCRRPIVRVKLADTHPKELATMFDSHVLVRICMC
jgi:hypothetical protein